jgi:hypothetical protein
MFSANASFPILTLMDISQRLATLNNLWFLRSSIDLAIPMNLSELTTQQIADLLWVLKGTPQAQALYEEYSSRPSKSCITPDDPDWEAKVKASLQSEA